MKRLIQDERGVTLAELMVAVLLLGIVSIVFTQLLSATLVATLDLQSASLNNDGVRLALQQIDRDFRGAERICLPDQGVGQSGDRLEFRTRAYAGDEPATGYQDVVYELRDLDADGTDDTLQRSVDGGDWRTVVEFVANPAIVDNEFNTYAGRVAGTAGVPLFETLGGTVDSAPSQGKVVVVRVWIDVTDADRLGPRLETTEVTGRNIWNPNADLC